MKRECNIFSTRARQKDRNREIERDREIRIGGGGGVGRHNITFTCGGGVFANIIIYYYYCTRHMCTCVNRYGAPSGRGAPMQRDRRDDFDDDYDTVPLTLRHPPATHATHKPTIYIYIPFTQLLFLCGYIHTTIAAADARKRIVNHR